MTLSARIPIHRATMKEAFANYFQVFGDGDSPLSDASMRIVYDAFVAGAFACMATEKDWRPEMFEYLNTVVGIDTDAVAREVAAAMRRGMD